MLIQGIIEMEEKSEMSTPKKSHVISCATKRRLELCEKEQVSECMDLNFVALQWIFHKSNIDGFGKLDIRKLAEAYVELFASTVVNQKLDDWAEYMTDKKGNNVLAEAVKMVQNFYWGSDNPVACQEFDDWLAKTGIDLENMPNIERHVSSKLAAYQPLPKRIKEEYYRRSVQHYRGNFTRKQSKPVTAALMVKLNDALINPRTLPSSITSLAEPVMSGPFAHVWKNNIILPGKYCEVFQKATKEVDGNARPIFASEHHVGSSNLMRTKFICQSKFSRNPSPQEIFDRVKVVIDENRCKIQEERKNLNAKRMVLDAQEEYMRLKKCLHDKFGSEKSGHILTKLFDVVQDFLKSFHVAASTDDFFKAISDLTIRKAILERKEGKKSYQINHTNLNTAGKNKTEMAILK